MNNYLTAICMLPYCNMYATLLQYVCYLAAIMNNYLTAICAKVLLQYAIRYKNIKISAESLMNTAKGRFFAVFTLLQFAQTYRYTIDNKEILIDIIFRKLYLEMYFRYEIEIDKKKKKKFLI